MPFVRVGRAWWDSHGQNFETHQELVPELDHVMATLLDDLEERGLLENTLVITLAEFGRTPSINSQPGPRPLRHAPGAATLSGCGIKGGSVYGKTDETGNRVVDGEIGAARAVRHDLPRPRHQPPEELLRRLAPDPADRPRHRADPRSAGVSAVPIA